MLDIIFKQKPHKKRSQRYVVFKAQTRLITKVIYTIERRIGRRMALTQKQDVNWKHLHPNEAYIGNVSTFVANPPKFQQNTDFMPNHEYFRVSE